MAKRKESLVKVARKTVPEISEQMEEDALSLCPGSDFFDEDEDEDDADYFFYDEWW